MPNERQLTDKELLAIFTDDRADLSLLTEGEQQRLLALTADTPMKRPTAPPEDATRGTVPMSTPEGDPPPQAFGALGIRTVPDDEWAQLSPMQKTMGLLDAAGRGMTHAFGLGSDMQDNPKMTLATAAVPLVAKGAMAARAAMPTRAGAGAKFQQVMAKVGDQVVDTAPIGDPALRISQLAERGSSMPQAVRKLLLRATDPDKADITYREMRDFYSNISRLSADEAKRLSPVMKKELGELRVAMDHVLAKTAASGGMESVYRRAMKEYAMASRIREFSEKAAKWGAGIAGAGTAYNFLKD